MREIKLRYVIKYKRTNEVYLRTPDTIEDIEKGKSLEFFEYENWEIIDRNEFTGHLDRQGKEIYEGDILRFDDIPNRISPVVFENGMFKSKHYIGVEFCRSEVIGNIYENPELIENLKL